MIFLFCNQSSCIVTSASTSRPWYPSEFEPVLIQQRPHSSPTRGNQVAWPRTKSRMGNLLKLLSRDDCPKYDVFVDFESKCVLQRLKRSFLFRDLVHFYDSNSKVFEFPSFWSSFSSPASNYVSKSVPLKISPMFVFYSLSLSLSLWYILMIPAMRESSKFTRFRPV